MGTLSREATQHFRFCLPSVLGSTLIRKYTPKGENSSFVEPSLEALLQTERHRSCFPWKIAKYIKVDKPITETKKNLPGLSNIVTRETTLITVFGSQLGHTLLPLLLLSVERICSERILFPFRAAPCQKGDTNYQTKVISQKMNWYTYRGSNSDNFILPLFSMLF